MYNSIKEPRSLAEVRKRRTCVFVVKDESGIDDGE